MEISTQTCWGDRKVYSSLYYWQKILKLNLIAAILLILALIIYLNNIK
jgi:hypothetical protein